jgi:hypothetical protein
MLNSLSAAVIGQRESQNQWASVPDRCARGEFRMCALLQIMCVLLNR